MATELRGFTISATADVDLSEKQFHVVKLLNNGNIGLCDAGDVPVGILQNQPYAGQAAAVMVTGQSKVVVGDTAIVPGARVASVGGVVFAEAEGNHTIGQCREGAGPGQIASVLINCFNTTEKPAEIPDEIPGGGGTGGDGTGGDGGTGGDDTGGNDGDEGTEGI